MVNEDLAEKVGEFVDIRCNICFAIFKFRKRGEDDKADKIIQILLRVLDDMSLRKAEEKISEITEELGFKVSYGSIRRHLIHTLGEEFVKQRLEGTRLKKISESLKRSWTYWVTQDEYWEALCEIIDKNNAVSLEELMERINKLIGKNMDLKTHLMMLRYLFEKGKVQIIIRKK